MLVSNASLSEKETALRLPLRLTHCMEKDHLQWHACHEKRPTFAPAEHVNSSRIESTFFTDLLDCRFSFSLSSFMSRTSCLFRAVNL
eukprot:s1854_g4.t1